MHESHMEPVTGGVSPELLSQILLGVYLCLQIAILEIQWIANTLTQVHSTWKFSLWIDLLYGVLKLRPRYKL